MMHLQAAIEHTLDAELKYKWKLPCYYIKKGPICYITQSRDFVDLGFWHAAHFSRMFDGYLISEKRRMVKSLRYKTLEEIDGDILVSILKEIESHKDRSFWK